jgi:hypothetical protein
MRLMNHLTEADLQSWIDEELDPAERIRVADHLASCTDCRRETGDLRAASELFHDALVLHDKDLVSAGGRRRPATVLPRWVGRAAAVTLLLGGAAVAAVVPGSPLRGLFVEPEPVELAARASAEPASTETEGASITVRPVAGELLVRLRAFPAGTNIRLVLTDDDVAIANLPHGGATARFVVAAGMLEVLGPGSGQVAADGDGLVLRLPRWMDAGIVELDGVVVARVSEGRISAERRVTRMGDGEVVIEVGG